MSENSFFSQPITSHQDSAAFANLHSSTREPRFRLESRFPSTLTMCPCPLSPPTLSASTTPTECRTSLQQGHVAAVALKFDAFLHISRSFQESRIIISQNFEASTKIFKIVSIISDKFQAAFQRFSKIFKQFEAISKNYNEQTPRSACWCIEIPSNSNNYKEFAKISKYFPTISSNFIHSWGEIIEEDKSNVLTSHQAGSEARPKAGWAHRTHEFLRQLNSGMLTHMHKLIHRSN